MANDMMVKELDQVVVRFFPRPQRWYAARRQHLSTVSATGGK